MYVNDKEMVFIGCLNYNNQERYDIMIRQFEQCGMSEKSHFYSGCKLSDSRIQSLADIYPDINNHTKKCWSCMFGHLDMMRDFVQSSTEDYMICCEDDIILDRDFKNKLDDLMITVREKNIDLLLLGYLITYPILSEQDTNEFRYRGKHIYVDLEIGEKIDYRFYEYGFEIWGTQMYMVSRSYAEKMVQQYADGIWLLENYGKAQFSADWILTKESPSRQLIYPMLAIEDGKTTYEHEGQSEFHRLSHSVHICANRNINYIDI